jgi:hypothetical protein
MRSLDWINQIDFGSSELSATCFYNLMISEEEPAFLNAHLEQLSPAVSRQLKKGNVAGNMGREAEVAAKARVGGKTQWPGRWASTRLCLRGDFRLPHGPQATEGKRKAKKMDSSDWGGSMEPAIRPPAPASACTGVRNLRPRPGDWIRRLHKRTSCI